MIIKRRHTGAFAVIPNLTANDDRLSAGALGLLVYLLAKPADWTVNVRQLRKRFGLGKNSIYRLMTELETCGYVRRTQARADASRQFRRVEYVVYDCPADLADQEPQTDNPSPENGDAPSPVATNQEPRPQIREAVISQQKAASPFSASPLAACGKSGHILKQTLQKQNLQIPYGEAGASLPEGADALIEKKIWNKVHDLAKGDKKTRTRLAGLVGELFSDKKGPRRITANDQKQALLSILERAEALGTLEPASYVKAAIDQQFPKPRDPKTFTESDWQRSAQAAIKCRSWPPEWGPAPGKKGCLVPHDLVTPELLKAIGAKPADNPQFRNTGNVVSIAERRPAA